MSLVRYPISANKNLGFSTCFSDAKLATFAATPVAGWSFIPFLHAALGKSNSAQINASETTLQLLMVRIYDIVMN